MYMLLMCENYACQAWGGDGDFFIHDACNAGANLRLFEANNIPVVVGEWSLATVSSAPICLQSSW